MSSNLTITYASQIAPGAASASVTAAVGTAPAADNPLGFLAALVDQLVAGTQEDTIKAMALENGATFAAAPLLERVFAPTASISLSMAPDPEKLVPDLTRQLNSLNMMLQAGETPDSEQLRRLNASLEVLSTMLDGPTEGVVPGTPATPGPAGVSANPTPVDAISHTTVPQPPAPAIGDARIADLLASLGAIASASGGTALPAITASADTAKAVTLLHGSLTSLSQTVTATSPTLAKKLDGLAARLEQSGGSTAFLGQVAPPGVDTDAATIGEIIRILLSEAPADPAVPASPGSFPDAFPAPVRDYSVPATPTPGAIPAPTFPGLPSPLADVEIAVAPPSTVTVPPLLLHLSTQLSKLSAELTAAVPEFAKKLEAVATRLVSADANATLLAGLTSATGQPDGTALDSLVRNLIEGKPLVTAPVPTTPQIAADTTLEIPAPIAPPVNSSDPEPLPPPPPPAPANSEPAPSLRASAVAAVATSEPGAVAIIAKSEPKAVAELAKLDPTANVQATPQQQPQPLLPTANARALPAAYQPVQNPINMGQVAFEMVRQVHQGTSRFTIRLDPPELGRVDVRMQVDPSGTVNARLTVERTETLDMFQRDQRSLERALAQAGLDSSRTNLEFSLRQNPFGNAPGDQRQQQHNFQSGDRFSLAAAEELTPAPAITLYRGIASAGGVNIFA